jgi:acyl-homoserine lactone acylase PvdQ
LSSHRMTRVLTAAGATAVLVASGSLLPAAGATAHAAGDRARPGPAAEHVGSGTESAVILRSSYGVPSVYASTTAGMWFGDGWAQAQDRLVQLELTRRSVEGTLSAIFGSAELSQDETVRTLFYTPAELTAQFESLPAATRAAIEAFSAGVNAYEAYAYGDPATRVPYEFFVLGQALGLGGGGSSAPYA